MTDIRDALIAAATQLYAEGGYRGTTTRKIAQLAEVNEITLFRHFGTKDDLLRTALQRHRQQFVTAAPDLEAPDLVAALQEWAEVFHGRIYNHRALIRQVMGDATEHPNLAMDPCDGAEHEPLVLAEWLEQRRARGDLADGAEVLTGAHLLVNALFTDAIWRDMAPVEMMPPVPEMVRAFVHFVVRGLGYTGTLDGAPLRQPAGLVAAAKDQ